MSAGDRELVQAGVELIGASSPRVGRGGARAARGIARVLRGYPCTPRPSTSDTRGAVQRLLSELREPARDEVLRALREGDLVCTEFQTGHLSLRRGSVDVGLRPSGLTCLRIHSHWRALRERPNYESGRLP